MEEVEIPWRKSPSSSENDTLVRRQMQTQLETIPKGFENQIFEIAQEAWRRTAINYQERRGEMIQ